MATSLTHRSGEMTRFTSAAQLAALVAELDGPDDPEHPDVAVSHESGWILSAFPSGLLLWENVEGDGPPRHRTSASRHEVIVLFESLATGDPATVESLDWSPGYGT